MPGFKSLRLPPGVETLADEHRGLILVTGATGVGKTTTLAAMVGHINRTRRQHVVTIEDPIEFLHDDEQSIVNQREVGIDTESFDEALRRVLRQDPDVILIGELRDRESAETALQAAESGHLVLSTMHTVDAAETLGRLVEFFPAAKQPQVRSILAGVLKGVISQRLLPRTDGGRIAAVEVMVANARIRELIRENKPELVPEAIAEGAFFQMQTLTKALIDLVVSGDVDEETAAAAAPEPPRLHDRARPRAQGAGGPERGTGERARARGAGRSGRPHAAPGQRPPHRLMRARLHVRRVAAAQDGFTLPEMLVVLAIIGVVLAGLTQLLTSALTSAEGPDEPHAGAAGREARPRQASPRDPLRERAHDAERLPRRRSVTITLGSYCPTAGGAAATVTWCTKDKNGAAPPVAGAALHALAVHGRAPAPAPGRNGRRTSWTIDAERHRRQDLQRRAPFRLPSLTSRRRPAGPWPRERIHTT